MTDTKITVVCEEGEDHITDISLTAERNYTPIFTEAFSTQEKPLGIPLSGGHFYENAYTHNLKAEIYDDNNNLLWRGNIEKKLLKDD